MDSYKMPEPIGDLDWGNLVVDLLACNDDLKFLKNAINQAIEERLYLAYLWYLYYKDSPEDYLLDHDVEVDFYKSLFGDLNAKLMQLAVNPGSAPERVGLRHFKNKVTDVRADRRSAGTFASGLELPEQLETLFMPPNDSFGFDDEQWLLLVDPEKTVFCSNSRPFLRTFPDAQLLAERKVLQSKIRCLFAPQKYDKKQS